MCSGMCAGSQSLCGGALCWIAPHMRRPPLLLGLSRVALLFSLENTTRWIVFSIDMFSLQFDLRFGRVCDRLRVFVPFCGRVWTRQWRDFTVNVRLYCQALTDNRLVRVLSCSLLFITYTWVEMQRCKARSGLSVLLNVQPPWSSVTQANRMKSSRLLIEAHNNVLNMWEIHFICCLYHSHYSNSITITLSSDIVSKTSVFTSTVVYIHTWFRSA